MNGGLVCQGLWFYSFDELSTSVDEDLDENI